MDSSPLLLSNTFFTVEICVSVKLEMRVETRCLHVKCLLLLPKFKQIRTDHQTLNSPILHLINICSAILKLFHAGKHTNRKMLTSALQE
jgi:hypothetical protein